MTSTEIQPRDIIRKIVTKSFRDFLPHVKILDPPPGGGVVSFQMWPHLEELAGAFALERLSIIPKPKQIGVSWILAAYAYWTAAYHEGAQVLEFSKGQLEAKDLLAKSAFIHRHLPSYMQGMAEIFTESITFSDTNSRIMALPSTQDAGIGQTATLVIMDEADFHDYLSQNYDNAAKPTVDAGGQLIMASTVNPEKVNSPFQQRVREAGEKVAGNNGFARFFYPYTVRPGRDQAWYDRTVAEADDPRVVTKNYPRNLAEALAPARSMAYFDADILDWMMGNMVQEPFRQEGYVSIWKPPAHGLKYLLGGDTAWGQTGSYNAAAVFDWATMEQVAELHGRLHPNDMAYETFQLHKQYNHAYMGLERAGQGQERDGESVVVVDKIVSMLEDCSCYKRLFYSDWRIKKPQLPGWQTDMNTRPLMFGEFREAVRNRQVTIRSKDGVGEMMSFIRNEAGRMQAAEGAHDDRPVCYAIAWQMKKFARFSQRSSKPIYRGRTF